MRRILFALALSFTCSLNASQYSYTVTIPPTAILQWVGSETDRLTAVSPTTSFVLSADNHWQTDLYVAVLCNSLEGYEMTINPPSDQYVVTVIPIARTIHGASRVFGHEAKVDTTFDSPSALPLKPNEANVYHVIIALKHKPVARGIPISDTLSASLSLLSP